MIFVVDLFPSRKTPGSGLIFLDSTTISVQSFSMNSLPAGWTKNGAPLLLVNTIVIQIGLDRQTYLRISPISKYTAMIILANNNSGVNWDLGPLGPLALRETCSR